MAVNNLLPLIKLDCIKYRMESIFKENSVSYRCCEFLQLLFYKDKPIEEKIKTILIFPEALRYVH